MPNPSFLETSYLLIYGELPTAAERDEFSHGIRKHTLLHEDVKRFFDGFPKDAHPMATLSSVVTALVDLLPGQPRPQGPRAGAALDRPADGQAADHRRLRVQEVDRPAVRLPEQQARPHRELPHDDVLGAVGAYEVSHTVVTRAQEAAHPARRPRAELLHVDRAPGRLERGEHLRRDRRRASTRSGGRCTAAPTRWSSRCSKTSTADGGDIDKYVTMAKDPNDPFRLSGLRAPRLQELRPARPHPQGRPCDDVLTELGRRDHLLDLALELEAGRARTTSTSSSASSTRTSTSTPGSSTARWGSPRRCSPVLFAIGRLPGWIAHWKEMMREPGDEDRPSPPDLHRRDEAPVRPDRRAGLTRAADPLVVVDDRRGRVLGASLHRRVRARALEEHAVLGVADGVGDVLVGPDDRSRRWPASSRP